MHKRYCSLALNHRYDFNPFVTYTFGWHWLYSKSKLTHWGRVILICISKLTIIGSDNGLSPGRRQAIIWTIDGILLIWPLRTKFSEVLIKIHILSSKKTHLKMFSAKWRPFCLGLNVLSSAFFVNFIIEAAFSGFYLLWDDQENVILALLHVKLLVQNRCST